MNDQQVAGHLESQERGQYATPVLHSETQVLFYIQS